MALGWEVFIIRKVEGEPTVAIFRAGLGGLDWLDKLVKAGKAEDLGGDGYPCRYTAKASVIIPIISDKIPTGKSPLVIGDDYVQPENWGGRLMVKPEVVAQCSPDEVLMIKAWDQS